MSDERLTVAAVDKLKQDIKSSQENLKRLVENICHVEKDEQKSAITSLIKKEIPAQFQQQFYMNLARVILFGQDLKLQKLALLALAKHIQKADARKFLHDKSAGAKAVQKTCWRVLLNFGASQKSTELCKEVGKALINFVKVMPARLWQDNIDANMVIGEGVGGATLRKEAIGLIKKLFIESPPRDQEFYFILFMLQGNDKEAQSHSAPADKALTEALGAASPLPILDVKKVEADVSGKNFYSAVQSSFWERRFPIVNASERRSVSLSAPRIQTTNEESVDEIPAADLSPH